MTLIRLSLLDLSRGALIALALVFAGAARADDALAVKIDAALLRLGPHPVAAVRVIALPAGEILYERNADLSMNPASTMKLVTSAAALAKLGPDHRFTTRVLVTGSRKSGRYGSGVLAGDLVLQGGGDPVLETPHLEKLADAVRAAGIRKVTGGLRVDDHRYDAERLGIGWSWDDEPYYYNPQISALSVNRNILTVDIRPGRTVGAPALVELRPLAGYMAVGARPKTIETGGDTKIEVTRTRGRNTLRVTGTIPLAGEPVRAREVTMEDPAAFAGALFKKLLADRGVRVVGPVVRGATPAGARGVASHQSITLSEILPLLNKPSDNLIAEMLLKEIGFVCKNSGDVYKGSEVVEQWLRDIGIVTTGVRMNDGSGLSRMDLVTARVLSDLLVKIETMPWKDAFVRSLAISGVDGTLKNRFKGTAAEKNLHGKTGTLAHITALAGYLTTVRGERLAFSMLVNHYPGRMSGPDGAKRVEDAIVLLLAERDGMTR